MLLAIEKLRGGAIRDADQSRHSSFGVSRTIAIDLKRSERRRETLRETFMVPDLVTAPVWRRHAGRRSPRRVPRQARRALSASSSPDLLWGENASEVGQELGVKDGNVRVIRHRAIERLRTCMTSREGCSDGNVQGSDSRGER
jgi:RNA polymerase sigma-70 factor (ECF subfamily)